MDQTGLDFISLLKRSIQADGGLYLRPDVTRALVQWVEFLHSENRTLNQHIKELHESLKPILTPEAISRIGLG